MKMMMMMKMKFPTWVSSLDWKLVFIIVPMTLSLFIFLHFSPATAVFNPILRVFFSNSNHTNTNNNYEKLLESKIAVCLVGGARKFELTGPSIVEHILNQYPNSDLFLSSPLDRDAYKFSFLKAAPRIASIRIFEPTPIPETPELVQLLSPAGSPNGIQGLLQYFSLVEGCLTLIKAYQTTHNFTYDWIVRARVDGYWNAPLNPNSFVPGQYVVPSGSTYWGLNDRHGVGDFNTSIVALSRFSVLPKLISAGFKDINSESAFKGQFTIQKVPYVAQRLPFCVVTDRKYPFPPVRGCVPVAATSSPGPLSGVKCRPCSKTCNGECVAKAMNEMHIEWGWTDWANGTLQLCDSEQELENGWESVFDRDAGTKFAESRKQILKLNLKDCVRSFEEMKRRSGNWESPLFEKICKLGLNINNTTHVP